MFGPGPELRVLRSSAELTQHVPVAVSFLLNPALGDPVIGRGFPAEWDLEMEYFNFDILGRETVVPKEGKC